MCTIPKVFSYDKICLVMKLNKSKVIELIRLKNNGSTTYQARLMKDLFRQLFQEIKNWIWKNCRKSLCSKKSNWQRQKK